MADELDQIASNMDWREKQDLLIMDDIDGLHQDYTPEPDVVHDLVVGKLVSEYPQISALELRPLGRYDRPDYVMHIRHDYNWQKAVDDARHLARSFPNKIITFEFPPGDKFRFVPREA
jgi:hypothetical protein